MSNILIAGIDEVGRGPLAGPVVAAAVILPNNHNLPGLTDSKLMTERKRESLFGQIKDTAIAFAIGRADIDEIDRLNILQASLLAMQRAVEALAIVPDRIVVDGLYCPKVAMPAEAIVKGDKSVPAISAAAVLAKVTRDAEMIVLDDHYPGYGFASHKGYPSRQHLQALQELGVSPIHRRSFAPVRRVLETAAAEVY